MALVVTLVSFLSAIDAYLDRQSQLSIENLHLNSISSFAHNYSTVHSKNSHLDLLWNCTNIGMNNDILISNLHHHHSNQPTEIVTNAQIVYDIGIVITGQSTGLLFNQHHI